MEKLDSKITALQSIEWRKRLMLITDVVFVLAMTLLIFTVEIPRDGDLSNLKKATAFFANQLLTMADVIITFITISVYWIKHIEIYSLIEKVNQKIIGFQLGYLIFMLLMPFWNVFDSAYPDSPIIKSLLSLNMILVGLFSYLSWNYATNQKHRLVHSNITDQVVHTYKKQILTEPTLAFIAACVSFITPYLWDVVMVLVPILFAFRPKVSYVKFIKLIPFKRNKVR